MMMKDYIIHSIVFDMDGTLVDSKLDFDLMREEIGIPAGQPILEYVEASSDQQFIKHAFRVIHEHESRGAREAEILRDAMEFLSYLKSRNIPTAILTRNSKEITKITLDKFALKFNQVITRDCAPAKPKPDALIALAKDFKLQLENILYIGDHDFDLETARNAGCIAGLFKQDYNQHLIHKADLAISQFEELKPYLYE